MLCARGYMASGMAWHGTTRHGIWQGIPLYINVYFASDSQFKFNAADAMPGLLSFISNWQSIDANERKNTSRECGNALKGSGAVCSFNFVQ